MDGIEECHKLDKYLSKSVEKVCDPVAWWWEHHHIYLKLSKMAFNYLSIL
jgi:hAT family C-terminal dimerisation region